MATGDARAQNRKDVFKRKQRTQTRDGDCRFGVEEDWTGAHHHQKEGRSVGGCHSCDSDGLALAVPQSLVLRLV